MADRIDEYLQVGADKRDLTPEECAQADAVLHAVEETRSFLDSVPPPDVAAAVMRQIGERKPLHASAWRRVASLLWQSRRLEFQLRPVYVLIAIAAISLTMLQLRSWWLPAEGEGTEPRYFVQFRLEAPDASDVRLAGSFTGWQPQYELHRTEAGLWTITLPLALGVHDYSFVVDGKRWIADPYAQGIDDGFGGTNSRIALLAPDKPRS